MDDLILNLTAVFLSKCVYAMIDFGQDEGQDILHLVLEEFLFYFKVFLVNFLFFKVKVIWDDFD